MTPVPINVSDRAEGATRRREIDIERKPRSFPCLGPEIRKFFQPGK